MDKRVLLFINPVSGAGKSREFANHIIDYARKINVNCTVVEPESSEEVLVDLSKALNMASFDALIAIGGDGLVHQAIQLISATNIPMFVVPAGTGNDFARANRILETKPENILRAIYQTEPVSIDIGSINHNGGKKVFAQILSTGFDAQVNEQANRNQIVSGKMKYNFATAVILPKFKPIDYEIEVDGVARNLSAMLIAVANGPTYGGGMQLCPMADRQDGFLDILILHPVSKIELIKVFPKVYTGKHVTHPAVEFIKAKKIKISAKTLAYADGERIGNLPITVEILPRSLRTWVAM